MSGGKCPGGTCPGGFCPVTEILHVGLKSMGSKWLRF